VDAQGGRLGIASVYGEGATFTFTVPSVEVAGIVGPRQGRDVTAHV
jgi:hypothetical protein